MWDCCRSNTVQVRKHVSELLFREKPLGLESVACDSRDQISGLNLEDFEAFMSCQSL